MKRCVMFAALLLGLTGNALADDPSGNWKFSATLGKKSAEVTLKLKLEGEKLTGSITAAQGNRELPLSDGTFKDDKVSFSVTIERGDQKLTQKYSGTLSGDTIKGKIDSERGGKSRSADWEAKRVK